MVNLLNSGDVVALVSPSIALNSKLNVNVDRVRSFLEALGLQVRVMPSCYHGLSLSDTSDKEKVADVMDAYRDSKVKALFALHGGAGSLRLLPYLDFNVIKNNPKPFIGFSDTSSIQMGIFTQAGLPYISGFLGEYEFRSGQPDSQVLSDLFAVMEGRKFVVREGKMLRGGLADGVLIGGNLSILSDLTGTSYYPNLDDKILLLEDECEKPYKISLMLTQLRLNPAFKNVKGVVFGRFSECEDANSTFGALDEVIDDFVRHIHVPVVKDFNYGHFPSRHVLTLGVPYHLDADNCLLEQV